MYDNASGTFQPHGGCRSLCYCYNLHNLFIQDDHDYQYVVQELKELQSFVRKVFMFIKDEQKVNESEGFSLAEIRAIPFQIGNGGVQRFPRAGRRLALRV